MCKNCNEKNAMTTSADILCVGCATDDAMAWTEIRDTYARIWNRAWTAMDRQIAAEKAARVAATA
jgi:hypothetical protein